MSEESKSPILANCFGCGNQKTEIVDAQEKVTKNGRLCLMGKCTRCGKTVSRFVSDPSKPALSAEEKKNNEKKRREEKKRERELNPELKGAQAKKAKKRRIRIGDLEITIIATEVTDESTPKRRKLTAKEKREKEIKELKDKNSELEKHLKEILEQLDEESEGEAESPDEEEETSEETSKE